MAKFIMYVVVSFLTFKVQIKMYKATQFDIRPSTNTMLNIHPYRMYLNSSSTGQCVVLFTIFDNSPNTSGKLYQPFVELCIYRSPIFYLCTRAASLELPLAVIQRSSRNDLKPAPGITRAIFLLVCFHDVLYAPLANVQSLASPQLKFYDFL